MNQKTAKKILEQVVKNYDNISDEFSNSRSFFWKDFNNFDSYLEKANTIVDIGCGNGRFYKYLQENCFNAKYKGIDNSENLVKIAKQKYPEAKFKKGNLMDIPEKANSTDMIVAIASFHHIPSKKLRRKVLKEFHRVLKEDGILIISVWNLFQKSYAKYIIKAFIRWIFTLGKYDINDCFIPWGNKNINRYYHAFTNGELGKLLHKNGFQILEENTGKNINLICKRI